MRRLGLWGICGAGLILGLVALRHPVEGPPAPMPVPSPRGIERLAPPPRRVLDPEVLTETPATEPSSERLLREARQVEGECGLGLSTRCDQGRCVAVLVAPDLDRFSGWLAMSLRSPRFVLNTALRDLGLPPRALPCGQAVGQLTETAEIASVGLADGQEVWCSAPADAGWDPQIRALCTEAAQARGLQPDFASPALRLLSFERGE